MAKPRPRYLTKSRYKLALECPTKLFYAGKPKVYADESVDDAFLRALARGGFQVGALAQGYFPDGIEIKATDHDAAVQQTDKLLAENDNVTIFEAAVRAGDLFVRVDVLHKSGNTLQLIEVKSKSFDPREENPFFDKTALKKGIHKLSADYAPYLYDVAFQTYVCGKAHPLFTIASFLMLPNKAAVTTVDGLNQHFLLKEDAGRPVVIVKPGLGPIQLGAEILVKVNVDEVVRLIHGDKNAERGPEDRTQGLGYVAEISLFAQRYAEDQKITTPPSAHCKHCEFRAEPGAGQRSGFDECWRSEARVKPQDLSQPFVFDIWNFRGAQKLIDAGKLFVKQLAKDDLPTKTGDAGLSMSERQWLQVEKAQTGSTEPFVDAAGLRASFSAWRFPLHFIDFETTMNAIPFTMGRRPYEQVAFQFSHHVVHENGRVEHADQYLNGKRGAFPNFDFVRALKGALEKDQGTIFRYAAHENTVLCQIHEQLRGSAEPDAADLMAWIRTITTSSAKSAEPWDGDRAMVDLCELVKRYYYHPLTNGSNSIKSVLPAILNASATLRARYSKPIYGGADGIKSLNFLAWSWIELNADGSVKDPYKRLPSVYRGLDRHQLDLLLGEDELADGGAAMTAYAMMQFTEMTNQERALISEALLRYCELDTFAMVLLYEYWADILGLSKTKKAA